MDLRDGHALFAIDEEIVKDLSDEELVKLYRETEDPIVYQALFDRYRYFLWHLVSQLHSFDPQIGFSAALEGFFHAVRNYDETKTNFRKFLEVCVTNKLRTSYVSNIRFVAHEKQRSEYTDDRGNEYADCVSFQISEEGFWDENFHRIDEINDILNIIEILRNSLMRYNVYLNIFEEKILMMLMMGYDIPHIAAYLGVSNKQIHNQIARLKKLLEDYGIKDIITAA